jgi:hypothetical protein
MIIPGFIITWLTFPGVIVHELAHLAFCRITNTPVLQVCYFRFGNPAGFVIHEPPSSIWRHILIGIGPLFVNTLTGLTIGAALGLMRIEIDELSLVSGTALWLGVSIAMHSFPSTGDAQSIWAALWVAGTPLAARLVGAPLVGLIYLGALGSILWLDLIYGMALSSGPWNSWLAERAGFLDDFPCACPQFDWQGRDPARFDATGWKPVLRRTGCQPVACLCSGSAD